MSLSKRFLHTALCSSAWKAKHVWNRHYMKQNGHTCQCSMISAKTERHHICRRSGSFRKNESRFLGRTTRELRRMAGSIQRRRRTLPNDGSLFIRQRKTTGDRCQRHRTKIDSLGEDDKHNQVTIPVDLKAGYNHIRMGNSYNWAPDIDCFTLTKGM